MTGGKKGGGGEHHEGEHDHEHHHDHGHEGGEGHHHSPGPPGPSPVGPPGPSRADNPPVHTPLARPNLSERFVVVGVTRHANEADGLYVDLQGIGEEVRPDHMTLQMSVRIERADLAGFVVGQEFYVDFTKAS